MDRSYLLYISPRQAGWTSPGAPEIFYHGERIEKTGVGHGSSRVGRDSGGGCTRGAYLYSQVRRMQVMECGGCKSSEQQQPDQEFQGALGNDNRSRPGRGSHVHGGFLGLSYWWGSWRRLVWLWAVLVVADITLTAPGVWCQNDGSFTFSPGPGGDPYPEGFNCSSYCSWQEACSSNPGCLVDNYTLELIPTVKDSNYAYYMAARFMRTQPVRLWGTSFWTFFVFRVSEVAPHKIGDGFAFLISPNTTTPAGSWGGILGRFENGVNSTTGEPSDGAGKDSRIVAVKFDTWRNGDDQPTPYVGLLLNNIRPTNSWSFVSNNKLGAENFLGTTFGVWVEYDAESRQMEVSMLDVGQAFVPTLAAVTGLRQEALTLFSSESSLNLTDSVAELSYVGFSSGTGDNGGMNEIFYWQFQMGESRVLSVPPPALGPSPAAVPALGPSPAVAVPAPGSSPAAGMSVAAIVAVACAVVLVVLIASGALLCFCRRKCFFCTWTGLGGRGGGKMNMANLTTLRANTSARKFCYDELRNATHNFAETSVLGEGGFGNVFRGQLKDGTAVAVKRISERSRQGEKEFFAEVTIIGRLRHKSLVPLLGWCFNTSKCELLLVYEYMPNGSLDRHVLRKGSSTSSIGASTSSSTSSRSSASYSLAVSSNEQSGVMSWETRYHVLQGVASALLYLHEDWQEGGGTLKQAVVHRDIKPSNVMLDADWNGRLGDFGMARVVEKNRPSETASVVVGTLGYMAPEYRQDGKISVKADVFSFGIVMLEVVTGRVPIDWRQPAHKRILVDWIRSLHQAGARLESAADPALKGAFNTEQVVLLLRLGLMCTADDPKDRPSMRYVVQSLPTSTNY